MEKCREKCRALSLCVCHMCKEGVMSRLLDLINRPPVEAPVEVRKAPNHTLEHLLRAHAVAKRTQELLASWDWCLWECATGPARIVILRDELVAGYPTRYPTYTEAELTLLSTIGDGTKRLVDEAKKITQAVVISNFVLSPVPCACIKGPGVCSLRIDESKPFSCAEVWATCQFSE